MAIVNNTIYPPRMSHDRLHHAAEARQWLAKAVGWIDQAEREKPKKGVGRLHWDQRLELHLLRREAEGMILGN